MSTSEAVRRDQTGTALAWIGLVIGGVLCGIAAFVIDTFILWEHSTGCDPGPAAPDEVFAGQLSMAVVLVVVSALWTVAALLLPRHRPAAITSALVAVLPALGYFAYGMDPASWIGGFCIPF